MSSSLAHYVIPQEEENDWEFFLKIFRRSGLQVATNHVEIIGWREEAYSFLRQNNLRRNAMNSTLRYFNRLQADLQAIRRPYNEALAVTKTIRDMYAHAIDLSEIGRLQRETMEQLQRNLSFTHTLHYTRTIEGVRSGAPTSKKTKPSIKEFKPKKDYRLLFGDIY